MTGRLSKVSGEVAATEASFDRNGSLGFMGGTGILALALALIEHKVLKFLRFLDPRDGEDDDDGSEVDMGICKLITIVNLRIFFRLCLDFSRGRE